MKDPIQLSNDLGDRICDVLNGEGELVTKWVAVAEVIGPDGKRYLRTFFPPELTEWDGVGMLSVAQSDFDASSTWITVEDDDD